MWTKFVLWLHHVMNPHCEECYSERAESEARSDYCPKCEIYKGQIAQDRQQINQLIQSILKVPEAPQETGYQMPKEFAPKQKSWAIRRAELEAADRERANALKSAVQPDRITADTLDEELNELHTVNLDANR